MDCYAALNVCAPACVINQNQQGETLALVLGSILISSKPFMKLGFKFAKQFAAYQTEHVITYAFKH